MLSTIFPNTYYVYRINGLVEVGVEEIRQGEYFFYCGLISAITRDNFFVFAMRDMRSIKTIEVHHNLIGSTVLSAMIIENKLKNLEKIEL